MSALERTLAIESIVGWSKTSVYGSSVLKSNVMTFENSAIATESSPIAISGELTAIQVLSTS